MTEMITTAAATARENARTHDGKFGTQACAEAELELAADLATGQDDPDVRGAQLATAWETAAQAAEDAQAKAEELQAVYLPARAAMDERSNQMRAAAQKADEDRAVAQKATAALYTAHGARYARYYASDVAGRAETAGWKLKVKRNGPDAAATDPNFVAATADHAASVAAREQLLEDHRAANNEFAALQREYLRVADHARTQQSRADRTRTSCRSPVCPPARRRSTTRRRRRAGAPSSPAWSSPAADRRGGARRTWAVRRACWHRL